MCCRGFNLSRLACLVALLGVAASAMEVRLGLPESERRGGAPTAADVLEAAVGGRMPTGLRRGGSFDGVAPSRVTVSEETRAALRKFTGAELSLALGTAAPVATLVRQVRDVWPAPQGSLGTPALVSGVSLVGETRAIGGSETAGTWVMSVGTHRDGSFHMRLMLRSAVLPGVDLELDIEHTHGDREVKDATAYVLRVVPAQGNREELQGAEREERTRIPVEEQAAAARDAADPASRRQLCPTNTGASIDVSWSYSSAARVANGQVNCETKIRNSAAELNWNIWPNSGASNVKINIINNVEVNFADEDTSNDLEDWHFSSDASNARNTDNADASFLMVQDVYSTSTTGIPCGVAYLRTPGVTPATFRRSGIVAYQCAESYYSFTHELGHNFGCQHGTSLTSDQSWTANAFGYADPSSRFRSIMAYGSMCASGPCTRVPRFAGPQPLNWGGADIGNTQRNNANVITAGADWTAQLGCNPSPTPVTQPNPIPGQANWPNEPYYGSGTPISTGSTGSTGSQTTTGAPATTGSGSGAATTRVISSTNEAAGSVPLAASLLAGVAAALVAA